MEDSRKEIRFYGMKPNKSLKRQIERQLTKWVMKRSPASPPVDETAYRVCIERESGNCLCCHVEVQIGSQSWEANDVGKDIQEALYHVLQHLAHSATGKARAALKNCTSESHSITEAIA